MNINGKELQFTIEDNKNVFPILTTVDKLNRKNFWKIYTIDNLIYRESWMQTKVKMGQENLSKIKTFEPSEAKGKNIGRKNATSPDQQALLEAHSKWLKKQDQGYSPLEEKKVEIFNLLPMLANKYSDRKKHIQFPVAVSKKLDGVRCVARLENNNVILTSRLRKELCYMDKIRTELKDIIGDLVLDGEIYSHDIPFTVISGACRSKVKKSENDDLLEYWIFDVCDTTKTYQERSDILKKLKEKSEECKHTNLKFVLYDIAKSHEDVIKYHDLYVSQGFEGVIIRDPQSLYISKRCNGLLKHKDFEDAEFEIVGTESGKGSEKDAIIFVCKHNNNTFSVRIRGSIETRKEMMKNSDSYIGKFLTVRYQKTGLVNDNDLPRFPVGISVRDYE